MGNPALKNQLNPQQLQVSLLRLRNHVKVTVRPLEMTVMTEVRARRRLPWLPGKTQYLVTASAPLLEKTSTLSKMILLITVLSTLGAQNIQVEEMV